MSFRVPELPPFRGSFPTTPRRDTLQPPLSAPLSSSAWSSSQHQHHSPAADAAAVVPSSLPAPHARSHTMSNAPMPATHRLHPSLVIVPNSNHRDQPGSMSPPLPGSIPPHNAHLSLPVSPRSRTRSEPINMRHAHASALSFGPWSVDFDSDLRAELGRITPAEAQRKVMAARVAYERVSVSRNANQNMNQSGANGGVGGEDRSRRIEKIRESVVESRMREEGEKQQQTGMQEKEERKRSRADSTSAVAAVSALSYKRRKEQPETAPGRDLLQVPENLGRINAPRRETSSKEWISRLSDVVAEEWTKAKREHKDMGENVEQELVDRVVSVVESHQLEANMDGMVLLCEIIDELTRRGVMASSD